MSINCDHKMTKYHEEEYFFPFLWKSENYSKLGLGVAFLFLVLFNFTHVLAAKTLSAFLVDGFSLNICVIEIIIFTICLAGMLTCVLVKHYLDNCAWVEPVGNIIPLGTIWNGGKILIDVALVILINKICFFN